MIPSFIDVDRRLVLRYAHPDHRTMNFSKVRIGASNDNLYDLATALASIQDASVTKVTTVLTRQLF